MRRSLLHAIPLFHGVNSAQITKLLKTSRRIQLERGALLLSPDQQSEAAYVVLTGRLRVHLSASGEPEIAEILPGECIGEISLISTSNPSAHVTAIVDSDLMIIEHDAFLDLIENSHVFAKNLLFTLADRVRSNNGVMASYLEELRLNQQNAHTDALTGLGNRRWMRDMFERELQRGQRDKLSVCLMMIDVDYFKHFNDRHGHVAGDRALLAVAEAIQQHIRPTDLVARFGGDEFIVLLPEIELNDALQTAQRLCTHIGSQFTGDSPPITVSIGITCATEEDDLETLVQRADAAMYRSKAAGRNSLSVLQA